MKPLDSAAAQIDRHADRPRLPRAPGFERGRSLAEARPAQPILLPPPEAREPAREMSPRQLANWAYDRYLEGTLDWEHYRLVGLPSELHPRFDQTIGALTGERAAPDRPRDMIAEWEGRLDFMRRHNADDTVLVGRVERVLELLRRTGEPPLDISV